MPSLSLWHWSNECPCGVADQPSPSSFCRSALASSSEISPCSAHCLMRINFCSSDSLNSSSTGAGGASTTQLTWATLWLVGFRAACRIRCWLRFGFLPLRLRGDLLRVTGAHSFFKACLEAHTWCHPRLFDWPAESAVAACLAGCRLRSGLEHPACGVHLVWHS